MEINEALAALRALAQPTRLALYRLLVPAGPTGMAVGELAEQLSVPHSTLSAHLGVLRAAGLVLDTREGRSIRCRADFGRMDALLAYLSENCCAGHGACAPLPTCSTLFPPGAAARAPLPRVRQRR